jgi:hypothetical protein
MTNLEQLLIIVKKEMRSKELLMSHDANTKATKNYWQGSLSALTYIKHVIEQLLSEENDDTKSN